MKYFILCTLLISVQSHASDIQYSAKPTVLDGCAVKFEIEKPKGVYAMMFHGKPYPLARFGETADITRASVQVAGEVLDYMAEPESNRAVLAIAQKLNGESRVSIIKYDAELLSTQLSSCLKEKRILYPPPPAIETPFATVPGPAALRQQAEMLGIDIADFYTCPCGESYSAVRMQTPPWKIDSLTLHISSNSCELRTSELSNAEFIQAAGSDDSKKTTCWAQVGLSTPTQQVNAKRRELPYFSEPVTRACYNIIEAKARQWFRAGGKISVVTSKDTSTIEQAASLDKLSCS